MNVLPAKGRYDLGIAIGFFLISAVAHLVWNPIYVYWQFVATTALFVSMLTFWLVKAWPRIGQFITRFYCLAVILDTLAEGLLQHVHRCTMNNIACTGRMFLVFFACWLVLNPLERWFAARRRGPPAQAPPAQPEPTVSPPTPAPPEEGSQIPFTPNKGVTYRMSAGRVFPS